MIKVGRNDLCPCGSGKKFKKCCIDKIERDWKEKKEEDIRAFNDADVGKTLIYCSNTEILYDQNEDYISNDEYLEVINSMKTDSRLIFSGEIEWNSFFPMHMIYYLSSDFEGLNKDYPKLVRTDFSEGLNVVKMTLDMKQKLCPLEYIDKVTIIDEYLYENDWYSLTIVQLFELFHSLDIDLSKC